MYPSISNSLAKARGQRAVSQNFQLMLCGIALCTLSIFICHYHVLKSVLISGYHTVELANGWAGLVITTESDFDQLNGAIVTLATDALSLFHLGILVKKDNPMAHALQDDASELPQNDSPLCADSNLTLLMT
ncbi:hypothetical protein EV424DRAFT_1560050 [Suillus variegatus]|nr:hypothetical protein EV424DRAFT_1560050 [Suillus variegatus]